MEQSQGHRRQGFPRPDIRLRAQEGKLAELYDECRERSRHRGQRKVRVNHDTSCRREEDRGFGCALGAAGFAVGSLQLVFANRLDTGAFELLSHLARSENNRRLGRRELRADHLRSRRRIGKENRPAGEQTAQQQHQALERVGLADGNRARELQRLKPAGDFLDARQQLAVADRPGARHECRTILDLRESLTQQSVQRLLRNRHAARYAWRPVPGRKRAADLRHTYAWNSAFWKSMLVCRSLWDGAQLKRVYSKCR